MNQSLYLSSKMDFGGQRQSFGFVGIATPDPFLFDPDSSLIGMMDSQI
jgi:hypothetical protein